MIDELVVFSRGLAAERRLVLRTPALVLITFVPVLSPPIRILLVSFSIVSLALRIIAKSLFVEVFRIFFILLPSRNHVRSVALAHIEIVAARDTHTCLHSNQMGVGVLFYGYTGSARWRLRHVGQCRINFLLSLFDLWFVLQSSFDVLDRPQLLSKY